MRHPLGARGTAALIASVAACAIASPAAAQTGGATSTPAPTPTTPTTTTPGVATLMPDGSAVAPPDAPRPVRKAINAANRIRLKPYVYGGGHKPFSSLLDRGYDCSGAVSYALYGGRFLRSPLPSGALMDWGEEGPGKWITVYAHGGHAYIVVAGLRFDTSMRDSDAPGPSSGPRWSRTLRESDAFVARHPLGY